VAVVLVSGVGYSTNAVLRGDRPLLLVVHERNGDWGFLDGGPYDATDGVAVHAAHVFDERPELSALSDLPLGWAAERTSEDSHWQRSPWIDEHGQDN
jgi:hypothetical protein